MATTTTTADLLVGRSKSNVADALCQAIALIAADCLDRQGSFTIALSGGSLPGFLSQLPQAFKNIQRDPQWSKWHVVLADERCVPLSSNESNLHALQEHFLNTVGIPNSQVHGINQELLRTGATVEGLARDYQTTLQRVLSNHSKNSHNNHIQYSALDLAVLGFGPDGHCCSLFPAHPLLLEDQKWVAGISNSPKPPSNRITLTFRVLNHHTHHVIVCGAGRSKQSVVSQVWNPHSILPLHPKHHYQSMGVSAYTARMVQPPPPFPCAMVHPHKSLTWIIDQEAASTSMGLLSNALAEVWVSPTKQSVANDLCRHIVHLCHSALEVRGVFTIAMSGGSLPALLSRLPLTFKDMGIAPHYEQWHVVLADERGVPDTHVDSNLFAIKKYFLNQPGVNIPPNHIHGIDVVSLSESIQVAAMDYESNLLAILEKTPDLLLDVALLGFGEDGHTCSLFPDHVLLQERHLYVASISDSPKPPSYRITFTFRTLNEHTRNAIFCGRGDAKRSVLHEILQTAYLHPNGNGNGNGETSKRVMAHVYPKYPCGMVRPKERLIYIVDDHAMKDVYIAPSEAEAEADTVTNTGPKLLARRGSSFLPRPTRAKLYVESTRDQVANELCAQIIRYASKAIAERNAFTIALSGGSLPALLSKLPQAFDEAGVDPHYHLWHVLMSDERCVPEEHVDSNMHALRRYLLQPLYEQILHQHIYGLDQVSLAESVELAAQDYERKVHSALDVSGGMLDLAVLGFGPDGHCCSLFPGHPLLQETKRWVAPITDSPKSPSNRVTLTLPLLNQHTRNILFCGVGDSKSSVLKGIFPKASIQPKGLHWEVEVTPKYPCAMIRPQQELVYLVDQSAMPEVAAVSNPSMTTAPQHALVLVADTKKDIPSRLLPLIVQHSQKAIQKRGIFTIALSGGSLPSLLSSLEEMFTHLSVDPHWSKWHILLADERCVPLADEDSNLGAIQQNLLDSIPIPDSQIHGIDESLLEAPTSVQAKAYEAKLRTVLAKAGGMLDLAVLGFGPDGHCCSLFPNHALLTERILWVAGIDSSPKPPPKRITLTLGILNEWTRNVIFCGAGASKQPILQQVFERAEVRQGPDCHVRIATNPAPFPCAMVTPQDHLAWVVDAEAMPRGLLAAASPSPSPKKSSL